MLKKIKRATRAISASLFHFPGGKFVWSKYKNWIITLDAQYTEIKPVTKVASLDPFVISPKANADSKPKHKLITKIYAA